MRVLDTFAGIGGFSLGLERCGMETVAFVEIDAYCRKVLAKNWPDVPQYGDIRNVTAERLKADGIIADVITGGFPCQDISHAGKRAGIGGERSGLWKELARLVGEVRPRFAILENVSALLSGDHGRWFQRILGDLAEIGYDCEWHCIPAAAVGAPHRRDRIWIIAYPQYPDTDSTRPHREEIDINGSTKQGHQQVRFAGSLCEILAHPTSSERDRIGAESRREQNGPTNSGQDVADPISERQPRQGESVNASDKEASGERETIDALDGGIGGIWAAEPDVGRVANGIPKRVDRLRCLGNAIVPQIAELIGMSLQEEAAGREKKLDQESVHA